jgi:Tol biopolymer transport system component
MRVAPGGDAEPFALDLEGVLGVRVSPEGDRMALAAGARRAVNLYIHDLVRSVTEELNTGGFADWPMEWSPDGASIAFSSDRDGGLSLYRIAADGSGEPERLGSSDRGQTMMSWSSDGVIAYLEGGDIWVLPPDGAPAPFFTSETAERYPTFSPDGRWLAYVSNQTGEAEVYVRAYPGPGAATRVSTDGGLSPAWSRDGQWIYFMANPRPGRRSMMVVDVAPGDPFRAGAPEPLIDPWLYGGTTPARNYDVLADGSFVVALDEDAFPAGDGDSAEAIPLRQRNGVGEFHVVLNFLEELRERAGN